MTIDIHDFIKWWQPKAEVYGKKSAIKGIIIILENVLQDKFMEYCTDKNRDLAICPNCHACAYNDEGFNVPHKPDLRIYAMYFLSLYKHDISSEDYFSVTDIDAKELNDFVAHISCNRF